MNKTENLQLNVWEKTDAIHMEDFNADNRKIDAAVGALLGERIYIGSYTGDGKDSRTISLPWEPKIMILFGSINGYSSYSILTQTDHRYSESSSSGASETYHPALNGKQLTIKYKSWYNRDNQVNQYILFR